MVFIKMTIQISKVGHSNLFQFVTHHYPKVNLVPRFDDPWPQTLKVTGRTQTKFTDGLMDNAIP